MDSLFGFIISSNFTHGWHRKDKEKYKKPIIKAISVEYIKVIFLRLQIKTGHTYRNK